MGPQRTVERAAQAVRRALEGVAIEDLHVRVIADSVRVHGLAGSYETKRLAGVRAQAAIPGVWVANGVRVARAAFHEDRDFAIRLDAPVRSAPKARRALDEGSLPVPGVTTVG